jgi:hypothetical protein
MWTFEQLCALETIGSNTNTGAIVAIHGVSGSGKSKLAEFCAHELPGFVDYWRIQDSPETAQTSQRAVIVDNGHLLTYTDVGKMLKPGQFSICAIFCDFYCCDFELVEQILSMPRLQLKRLTTSFTMSRQQCNFLNRILKPAQSNKSHQHTAFRSLGNYDAKSVHNSGLSRSIQVWTYCDDTDLLKICKKLCLAVPRELFWLNQTKSISVFHPFDGRLHDIMGPWKSFSLVVQSCTQPAEQIILLQKFGTRRLFFAPQPVDYLTVTNFVRQHRLPEQIVKMKTLIRLSGTLTRRTRNLQPSAVGLAIEYGLHFYLCFKKRPQWNLWLNTLSPDCIVYLDELFDRTITLLKVCNFSLTSVQYQRRMLAVNQSSLIVGVPDFIIDGGTVLEIKVTQQMQPVHITQAAIYWYLLQVSRPWEPAKCVILNPLEGSLVSIDHVIPSRLASFINR